MKHAILILGVLVAVSSAEAQSTAFTYQGRLMDAGAPADGLHDLQFRLFDASVGGSQIGPTQCSDNVLVTEGLFTTTLDFGQQYGTPTPRFLEIGVRADTGLNCSNTSGFVTLPRQMLTAAPLAIHARSAFTLASAAGAPANAVFVDNAGSVGIGTNAPTHKLHVAAPAPVLALQDSDSNLGAYVSFRDINNVERGWIGYGDETVPHLEVSNTRTVGNVGVFTENVERMTIRSSGNVGVGTTAPTASLDVRGDIALGSAGQFRASAGTENLRIIRGVVCDGANCGGTLTIVAGSGFSVSSLGDGHFSITFTTPFSAVPAVTATCQGFGGPSGALLFAMTQSVTASGANLQVLTRSAGSSLIGTIHFIAIGPR